jgi:hypothetical protein
MDRLRFLVETYLDYQKDRIRLENRLRSLPSELTEETFFKALAKDAHELEKQVAQEISKELENEPLWINYLSRINGVGETLAAYLIAWLCRDRTVKIWKKKKPNVTLPPYAKTIEDTKTYTIIEMPPVFDVASNPSKIHKYCGLSPGSSKKKKEKIHYNPKLKTLCWKIMRQLLMLEARGVPSKYAELFHKEKAEYDKRCPQPEKGSRKLKVHRTTVKIVMRIFMTNLWITYRRMKGLSLTAPYPSKLGHEMLTPESLLDK